MLTRNQLKTPTIKKIFYADSKLKKKYHPEITYYLYSMLSKMKC